MACTQSAGLVDHQRRLYLHKPGLLGLVEEEVDEGTLQTGTLAFVERESGAGHLVAQLEVDDVILGAEIPVGQRVGGQVGLVAEFGHHHIVGLALAHGHGDMRCVGQAYQLFVEALLRRRLLLAEALLLSLELGGAGLGLLGLFAQPLFHQTANLLGNLVLLGLHGVGFHLQGTAVGIESDDLTDTCLHVGHILNLQSGDDFVGMVFDVL